MEVRVTTEVTAVIIIV